MVKKKRRVVYLFGSHFQQLGGLESREGATHKAALGSGDCQGSRLRRQTAKKGPGRVIQLSRAEDQGHQPRRWGKAKAS